MAIIALSTETNNNQVPLPKRKDDKIQGTFHALQEHELRSLKDLGLLPTATYLHFIFRLLDPYQDKTLHINVPKFIKKWGIAKSSFHQALNKLKDLKTIKIGTDECVISYVSDPRQKSEILDNESEDTKNLSESSNDLSEDTKNLSEILDTDTIYIARDQNNKNNKNINTNLDAVGSNARTVNIYPEKTDNSNSEDSSFLVKSDFVEQECESIDPLAKEPTSTPTPNQENLNSREDQSSEACSTFENKASHKMKAEGELENPSVNSTQTVLQRGLEYEKELNKKPWQKIDFTSEDEAKLKHLQRYTQNPYERPWRRGRANYIKNLIPTLQRLNSWYLKPENRGKGYERSHLENLEKAIADWENNPFPALDAYDKMMSYVESSRGETEESEGDRVNEGQQDELLSLLSQSLGFEDF